MRQVLTKRKELILVLSILVVGLFLRVYKLPERTVFNADQEWMSYRVSDVFSGDLAIIGPVASVGNFSIGPGFIYLWTLFGMISGNAPIAGAYLSVFLGILTLLGIYLFIRYFIDKAVAIFMLFITSISSFLIFWDYIPWTPSLFYLSQILFLTGAYLITKKQFGYFLLSLGLVIGFQSHIGIFLSFISILPYFIFIWPVKPRLKTMVISVSILFLGFLPNIIFDITHGFVNLNRLLLTFRGDGADYYVGINKLIDVLASNSISLFYPKKVTVFDSILARIGLALVLSNGFRMLRNSKYKSLSLLLLFTVLFPALFFYVWQGKFSEYYLMMTVPSLIFLISLLFLNLKKNSLIVISVLLISSVFNYLNLKNYKVPFNLKAKENVARFMVEKAGTNDYGISLTTRYGEQFGFNYIFDYYGINADLPPKPGENKIFSIIIPEGFDGITGDKDFDGIGLIWQGI